MEKAAWNKAKKCEELLKNMKSSGGIGYEEPSKKLFDKVVTFANGGGSLGEYVPLEIGREYVLRIESTSAVRNVTCKMIMEDMNGEGVWGEYIEQGDDYRLEVAMISVYPEFDSDNEQTFVSILGVDSNGDMRVTITKPETIHPIDPKFLPEGVGGVKQNP